MWKPLHFCVKKRKKKDAEIQKNWEKLAALGRIAVENNSILSALAEQEAIVGEKSERLISSVAQEKMQQIQNSGEQGDRENRHQKIKHVIAGFIIYGLIATGITFGVLSYLK